MKRVRAAAVADVPEGAVVAVEVGGKPLVLCHYEGQFHALDGLCPHRNGPLGQGAFAGGRIVCPWHAWEFDCVTGEYDFNPAIRLERYRVTSQGGEIFVDLPEDA
jgi:nitrite reductase/ring-hydroxylating ferredoxin subunit